MHNKSRTIGALLVTAVAVLLFAIKLSRSHIAVLSPAGTIASQQKWLLIITVALMLIVVIPVFALTLYIPWKYRASNATNPEADYRPEWDHNKKLEALWWGLPCTIILVLATIAWSSSHSLDPTKPIASREQPITIQVVALQWKWLFIYPEQQIASVNYVRFPAGTPVNFQITADAPMNSFWIPRLGGQIYAMAGMTTQLHLMADQPGSFHGSSANLSGSGFAAMQFTADATTPGDFSTWVQDTKHGSNSLSLAAYSALARPNIPKSSQLFSTYETGLYDTVLMKYMAQPSGTMASSPKMEGMTH